MGNLQHFPLLGRYYCKILDELPKYLKVGECYRISGMLPGDLIVMIDTPLDMDYPNEVSYNLYFDSECKEPEIEFIIIIEFGLKHRIFVMEKLTQNKSSSVIHPGKYFREINSLFSEILKLFPDIKVDI